jgi:aspartate-semialdehyde dehydrogenase
MAVYTHTVNPGKAINLSLLREQLIAVAPSCTGAAWSQSLQSLRVYFDAVPDAATLAAVDAVIAAHDATGLSAAQQAAAQQTQSRQDARAQLAVNEIATITPAQADAWIDTNVTSLATAREALKRLAHAVIALARLAD